MNKSAMKIKKIWQILANPFLTYFGRLFLQTHLPDRCVWQSGNFERMAVIRSWTLYDRSLK
jgi:hypothetical protein